MEKEMNERLLLFSGDIHGCLKKIIWKISNQLGLSKVSLVIAGDFGVGFGSPKAMDVMYNSVKDRLEKHDIIVYVVRGNHDDPSYFDGKHDYPRIKFLEDHKVYEIEGKRIYPIGGAHSLDRDWRIDANKEEESYGSSKRYWWSGEKIKEKYEDLPDDVDIIVSHESPLSFKPVTVRDVNDYDLWEDIVKSRKYLDYILKEVRTDWWIHGHYHKSTSGNFGDVRYRGLDIEEIFEIR